VYMSAFGLLRKEDWKHKITCSMFDFKMVMGKNKTNDENKYRTIFEDFFLNKPREYGTTFCPSTTLL